MIRGAAPAHGAGRHAARAKVACRALAAIPIGHGLTYLVTAALSVVLPGDRTEAILSASMVSFGLYLAWILPSARQTSHDHFECYSVAECFGE